MTLKIVKGGKSNSGIYSGESDKGLFIIEATNTKDVKGYISEVDGKISVSGKLIPQVVRYESYKEAKRQINHIESNIQGLTLKILGKKAIEEILSNQENLDIVVPVADVKESHIVGVYDTTTKETIGYVAYNPSANNYYMKKNQEEVAFWESKEKVDAFIQGAKGLIAAYPNLELRAEQLK